MHTSRSSGGRYKHSMCFPCWQGTALQADDQGLCWFRGRCPRLLKYSLPGFSIAFVWRLPGLWLLPLILPLIRMDFSRRHFNFSHWAFYQAPQSLFVFWKTHVLGQTHISKTCSIYLSPFCVIVCVSPLRGLGGLLFFAILSILGIRPYFLFILLLINIFFLYFYSTAPAFCACVSFLAWGVKENRGKFLPIPKNNLSLQSFEGQRVYERFFLQNAVGR